MSAGVAGRRVASIVLIALLNFPAIAAGADGRRRPNYLHFESDSGKLIMLCQTSGTIARVDPDAGIIEAEAAVGEEPFALCGSVDNHRYYVSCRKGQAVVELDASSLRVLRRFALLGDPTGLAVSADGERLYVGVHSLDQVAVLDLATGQEIKRLLAGNGPEMVRRSPTDGRVYVTNLLSNKVPAGTPPQNEITIIDDATSRVADRIILENANVGRWIAFNSDGSLAIVAISRPKNLVPMVQVARGWVVNNGFVVLSPGGDEPPVQLLIDLPNQAFSDPHAVLVTPDDRKAYLTAAGVDTVLAIDLQKLEQVVADARAGRIERYADHLGLSRRYVTARIPVGGNPQALAVNADGSRLFVANRLDDSITVIDTATDEVIRTMTIGEPPPPDRLARGERLFHNAARTFHGQFACVSCHPDTGFDGLQYDLEPDGLGQNILDNRNLRDVVGTAPFKWVGTNPDITTQCGTRTAKWITRTGWLTLTQVVDLAAYIRSLEPVQNPYRLADGTLTPAQQRGKELFERTTTNDGQPLTDRDRCDFCHPGPKFTNMKTFDVGTKGAGDTKNKFDSAHLINIFESAPYLHDGRAATLEQVWTEYNPDDKHGVSSDWTKRQLNDLVEYLKAL